MNSGLATKSDMSLMETPAAVVIVDEALIDGTFWSMDELPRRDISKIPHPTIQETIQLLGRKRKGDPEISFLHLNHSNPVNDLGSEQRKVVEGNGWKISEMGDVLKL